MQAHGVSERRACRLIGAERTSVRYRSRRADDGALRSRLRDVAAERRRFGYRRLGWMLRREGEAVNLKKVYRLYREEGLAVRRRRGRKRATGPRAPLPLPLAANQRWSLDFMADQLANGRRFRILTVVDDFTRDCLATVVDTSLPGVRVVAELDRIIARRGRPAAMVSDNGAELTGRAVLAWAADQAVAWHYIQPGKPGQNAFIEASTPVCATNASMRPGSRAWPRPGESSRLGGSTTTPSGRMVGSAVYPRRCSPKPVPSQCSRAGRCARSGASRPVPLS